MRTVPMALAGLVGWLFSISICFAGPQGRSEAFVTRTFARVARLRAQLPTVTKTMRQRLETPKRDKATATAVMFELMRQTGMRVGEPTYAKARARTTAQGKTLTTPPSFGASTLRAEHVVALNTTTGTCQLRFDGKGHKAWNVQVTDPLLTEALAIFVTAASAQPKGSGSLFVSLNARTAIVRELAKVNAKPHDLRRAFANDALERALTAFPRPMSKEAAVEAFKGALEQTQEMMRHASSRTTKSYLDPSLPGRFFAGLTLDDV